MAKIISKDAAEGDCLYVALINIPAFSSHNAI
jgi:hypothetical protein